MTTAPLQLRRLLVAILAAFLASATVAPAKVLRVGTFKHSRGQYKTIQAAVDASHAGDWILIAPGLYHERADYTARNRPEAGVAGAAVWITGARHARIHLRGMDRNRVVVDGTKRSAPSCSAKPGDQDLGPVVKGKPIGRSGIEVFETSGVSVENLTACNFLRTTGEGGNEIWFNGGDGTGQVHMGRWNGDYLSATSSFYTDGAAAAKYGLFASNARGPGVLDHSYGSNMNDASLYIGACPDCNAVARHIHAQYSALGYSGTNSGGHLVIEKSEWDHNTAGIVTNSQNNDDVPSPQDGRCPPRSDTAPTYCTYFRGNDIHDNNNPNTPSTGAASFGPVGTGLVLAGGRFDTVQDNSIHDNGSWGVLFTPYPDTDDPPPLAHCQGGEVNGNGFKCYYDDWGNRLLGNRFTHNGYFGNPSNGDLGDISGNHTPQNCAAGNTDPAGFTSDPADYQTSHASCTAAGQGNGLDSVLTSQVICAGEVFGPCPAAPGMTYPRKTAVVMPKLTKQTTMPAPCKGVPKNPWCTK